MGKHQTAVSEIKPEFIVQQSALANGEEMRVFKKLKPILAEIRKNTKLRGFILKNSTRAIADVDKPGEATEMAVLASELFNSSRKLLSVCRNEQMKSTVMEGPKMRVLCLSIGGNQLSIFMEKSVDYERILERFASIEA